MLEALIVVVLLLGFFSPFIISKFLISDGEDAGSFNKLKLRLPKLVEGLSGLLLGLLQCSLSGCSMPFHHI